jgi:late competence protein required for DNA uptake (superfamily II DNA/RNA helicase)
LINKKIDEGMIQFMQELILLTSPPASGKTYWINSFNESLGDQKLLVISPLRALAEECKLKWGESIAVMTPEEWLIKKTPFDVIVFDEFHLFFYWGDSFRPMMWEAFFEISQNAKLTILLTATVSQEMKREVQLFACHFDSLTWIDHGNQKLRFEPTKYIKAPTTLWLLKQIESEKQNSGVKLIFCKYREEVFKLEKQLKLLGHHCISCVGGESKDMAKKLSKIPDPDFIICTTVLSHGVNLPKIKRIYFLYKIHNLDFWIQMVARGGRRGEDFEVFSLESPVELNWSPLKNYFHVLLIGIKRNLRLDPLLQHFFISK